MAALYDRVALIGLGLIAGSTSLAMREAGLAREVVGYARSKATRDTAREIGLVDRVTDSAAEAVRGADLVVLAVPVGAMGEVAAEIAPHLAGAARAGLALIWKLVLVVEFLGRSNGVGFRIHLDFQMFDITGVLANALAFVAVMLAIEWAVLGPLARRAARWRAP